MLRVDVDDSASTLNLKLQGRLVGDEAKNTRTLMMRYRAGMRVVVDLTDVTFVDDVGEDVLSFFGEFGADFIAETSYSRDLCERLDLRHTQRVPSNGNNMSAASGHNRGRRTPRTRRRLGDE